MAYTNFTLEDLENDFGVKNQIVELFNEIKAVYPSERLKDDLEEAAELPKRTEKSKSELIVSPILKEMRRRNDKFFTIYSGENLNADIERGLNGECDFIIAKDTASFDVNYPILQVVEAKRNDLEVGVSQCAAQMIGANIFNERKKREVPIIYGCVTTGDDWIFLKLERDTIFVDTKKYYLSEVENILGVFQEIIDYYKVILAN